MLKKSLSGLWVVPREAQTPPNQVQKPMKRGSTVEFVIIDPLHGRRGINGLSHTGAAGVLLSATYTTMLAPYDRANVYDPRYRPLNGGQKESLEDFSTASKGCETEATYSTENLLSAKTLARFSF